MMKVGDRIFTCEPYAYVVRKSFAETVCDACLRWAPEGLQPCNGCLRIHYCDAKCRQAGWIVHQQECGLIRRLDSKRQLSDTVHFVARVILKLRDGGLSTEVELPDGSKRRFTDMVSHREEILADRWERNRMDALYPTLHSFLGSLCPSRKVVETVYCTIRINAFNIRSDDYYLEEAIGQGLYLETSKLDHSCWPSTCSIFEGKTMSICIIDPDFKGTFSDLTIAYVNIMESRETRRSFLLNNYYFECNCPACSDDFNENECMKQACVKCPVCQGPVHPASPRPICGRCQVPLPWEVQQRYDRLEFEKYIFSSSLRFEDYCSGYEQMKTVCHPCDKMFFQVMKKVFESCKRSKNWPVALELCEAMCEAYVRYFPKYHFQVAMQMIRVCRLSSMLGRTEITNKYWKLALDILQVTHGENHPWVSKVHSAVIRDRPIS